MNRSVILKHNHLKAWLPHYIRLGLTFKNNLQLIYISVRYMVPYILTPRF